MKILGVFIDTEQDRDKSTGKLKRVYYVAKWRLIDGSYIIKRVGRDINKIKEKVEKFLEENRQIIEEDKKARREREEKQRKEINRRYEKKRKTKKEEKLRNRLNMALKEGKTTQMELQRKGVASNSTFSKFRKGASIGREIMSRLTEVLEEIERKKDGNNTGENNTEKSEKNVAEQQEK